MWSNLANEMTAEFRGLCAEEVSIYRFPSHVFVYNVDPFGLTRRVSSG